MAGLFRPGTYFRGYRSKLHRKILVPVPNKAIDRLSLANPATVPIRMDTMSSVAKFVVKKARLNAENGEADSPAIPFSSTLLDGELDYSTRLVLLREHIVKNSVSAFLVETQDAHQSEYVADHDKRREWLTGFTGSAGTALVTATKALMWTDGRYFLQVWLWCYYNFLTPIVLLDFRTLLLVFLCVCYVRSWCTKELRCSLNPYRLLCCTKYEYSSNTVVCSCYGRPRGVDAPCTSRWRSIPTT